MKTKRFLSSKWQQYLISALALIAGIIVGPIIEHIAPAPFKSTNIPITVSLFASILFLAAATISLSIWNSTNQNISSVENYTRVIAETLGQSAQVLGFEDGYSALEERFLRAEKEILILDKPVFDWEQGQLNYDDKRLKSASRKSFYMAIQEKIASMHGNENFKFEQIVQIPKNHKLQEIFSFDQLYEEQCEFIAQFSKDEPHFASVRISDIYFQNTFIIIDRTFLYLEFEISDPDTNQYSAPFVLFVDDPNSDTITNLLKLHQRIEAYSYLFEFTNSTN